jgi:hypothetical protein
VGKLSSRNNPKIDAFSPSSKITMERKRDRLKKLFRLSHDASQVYQYKALSLNDSIRLVELKPASSELKPIQGDLSEVQFSKNTQYEALSYVWGKDEFPRRCIFLAEISRLRRILPRP